MSFQEVCSRVRNKRQRGKQNSLTQEEEKSLSSSFEKLPKLLKCDTSMGFSYINTSSSDANKLNLSSGVYSSSPKTSPPITRNTSPRDRPKSPNSLTKAEQLSRPTSPSFASSSPISIMASPPSSLSNRNSNSPRNGGPSQRKSCTPRNSEDVPSETVHKSLQKNPSSENAHRPLPRIPSSENASKSKVENGNGNGNRSRNGSLSSTKERNRSREEEVCSLLRGMSLEKELHFGVFETKGKREHMEDRHEVLPFTATTSTDVPLQSESNDEVNHNSKPREASLPKAAITESTTDPHFAFFAVYDGHGGSLAAEYVRSHLLSNIMHHPLFVSDTEKAIREGILNTENEFNTMVLKENKDGMIGTTACVALIRGNVLFVANVGDSGAILCKKNGQFQNLTNPHRIKNPTEKERIAKTNGKILQNDRLGHPVWNSNIINIAVTRALGDAYFKDPQFTGGLNSGLIADPEITKINLTVNDQFMLLASDGFWDFVTEKEAVDYVMKNKKDPTVLCQELTSIAVHRTSRPDNTTVLLVSLYHN